MNKISKNDNKNKNSNNKQTKLATILTNKIKPVSYSEIIILKKC